MASGDSIDDLYHCIPQFVAAFDLQQMYYDLVHKILDVQQELDLCNKISLLKERKAVVIDALVKKHDWTENDRRVHAKALDTLLAISDHAAMTDEYSVLDDDDDDPSDASSDNASQPPYTTVPSSTSDAEFETLRHMGTTNMYLGTGTFVLTALNLLVSVSTLVYVLDRFT